MKQQTLTFLLIEDEAVECQAITQCAESTEGLQMIGCTDDINQAINYVQDFKPDALILDLELHFGHGNGIDFLKELNSLKLDYSPFILITTNNSSKFIYRQVRHLGADFIMAKFQKDYSARLVTEFLCSIKNTIHNISNSIKTSEKPSSNSSSSPQKLKQRINTELNLVGINPRVLGRRYLMDAILLIIDDSSQKVCPIIAAQYSKSDASIERAMQNAINQAWRITNIDDLNQFYTARIRSDKGVPTYTEFIYYYANKLKADC